MIHNKFICIFISHEIFAVFWSLTLSDLQVPTEAYSRQIASYNAEIRAIEKDNIVSNLILTMLTY